MKRITGYDIRIIPQEEQRFQGTGEFYSTSGNWWYEGPDDNAILFIRISAMPDQRHEQLVAIHELAEAILCNQQGVTQEAVDRFDIAYEGRTANTEGEPGDEPLAPYQNQHCFATSIERMMCAALGIPWAVYEEAINKLFKK